MYCKEIVFGLCFTLISVFEYVYVGRDVRDQPLKNKYNWWWKV